MRARTGVYLLVGFNLLYVASLGTCIFLLGGLRPLDFAAMRSKVEASPSLEDLRSRALHAVSAIESGNQAIATLHDVVVRLVFVGIMWAMTNSLALYLLLRRVTP